MLIFSESETSLMRAYRIYICVVNFLFLSSGENLQHPDNIRIFRRGFIYPSCMIECVLSDDILMRDLTALHNAEVIKYNQSCF